VFSNIWFRSSEFIGTSKSSAVDDPKVRLLFRLEELPDLSDLESGTSPSRDNIVGPASSLNVGWGMDFGWYLAVVPCACGVVCVKMTKKNQN
jgi:hypothetical protein